MDFYINLTFKVQKGRGLVSRDPISKFWDPLITFERIELSASNLAQTQRTNPYCVRIIKRPQSGRGLSHVTKFRKFGTPYNFGTNRDFCFKFGTVIDDGPLLRPDHKTTAKWAWPGSCDQISKFWDPLITFWTNRDICLKFGTDIGDGSLLRPDRKMATKSAWLPSRDRILHWKDEFLPSQLMLHQI